MKEKKADIDILEEKEKKSIELLKQEPDFSLSYYKRENAIDIVLKLVETLIAKNKELKEETEEIKDRNKKLQDKAKELIFEKQELTSALLDSTPNDKIKAKIEELEKLQKEFPDNDEIRIKIIAYTVFLYHL